MRYTILAVMLACVCALCGAIVARAEAPEQPGDTTTAATTDTTATTTEVVESKAQRARVQRAIDGYRHLVWHWQHVMGVRVLQTLRNPPDDPAARIATWKRIARYTWRIAQHPPHAAAWQCIHRFEGAWNDPYAPYYGGLQMDLGFQQTYGAYLLALKGTADHWSPLEQMWVAERAFRSGRGFYPWPNTARYCGLI